MVNLGWVVIWVRLGVDRGALPWLDDGWHEKKQNKDPKYYFLGHKRSMTDRYMGNIDGQTTPKSTKGVGVHSGWIRD